MKKREGWLDIGRRIIEEKLSINVLRAEAFENAYGRLTLVFPLYVKGSSFSALYREPSINAFKFHARVVAIITGVMLLSIGQMSVGDFSRLSDFVGGRTT